MNFRYQRQGSRFFSLSFAVLFHHFLVSICFWIVCTSFHFILIHSSSSLISPFFSLFLSLLVFFFFFLSTLRFLFDSVCVWAVFYSSKIIWLNSIYSSGLILLLDLRYFLWALSLSLSLSFRLSFSTFFRSVCFMLRDMHFFRVCLLIRLIDRKEKKKTRPIFFFSYSALFLVLNKAKKKIFVWDDHK